MLKKRIIPCLDVKDGRTVKGTNFLNLRDAGDAVELAQYYSQAGADELVFLDISASQEKRKTLKELSAAVAAKVAIPFTVGGGIKSPDDAARLLDAGADKISINSAALQAPALIEKIAGRYGSQFLTVAVDSQWEKDHYAVYSHGGTKRTKWTLEAWLKEVQERGAGEILLTSISGDGTKKGFDLAMYRSIQDIRIPLIASGGAGTMAHFKEVLDLPWVDAALAASLFHFKELEIETLKRFLHQKNIPIRL